MNTFFKTILLFLLTTAIHADTAVLNKNWNLIGINANLSLSELREKLGPDNVLAIQGGVTEVYKKSNEAFLNSFTELKPGQGYWIKLETGVTLEYIPVTYEDKTIQLASGWNLINPMSNLTLEEIKTQVGDTNLEVIQRAGEVYKKDNEAFLNSFKKFKEPFGYWVKVQNGDNLSFNNLPIANKTILGIHITETHTTSQYTQNLDLASDIGLKVARLPLDWNALEPEKGVMSQWYINAVKSRVAHAQSNGQKVVLLFAQSPGWANGYNTPSYPPTVNYYQDFANAMKYLHKELISEHDNYNINNQSILAWEVWNEPNVVEFWPTHMARPDAYVLIDLNAAKKYAQLLKQTYETMKLHYPNVTILGGSLAAADTDYLHAMYDYWGGESKFDALSLHPYTRVDENSGSNYGKVQYPDQCNSSDSLAPPWCYKKGVENIRDELDSFGDTSKEIWFTEFGTSSSSEWGGAGSKAEQREHTKLALDILEQWNQDSNKMKIPVAIIYRLFDQGTERYGLYDETKNLKPAGEEIKGRLNGI